MADQEHECTVADPFLRPVDDMAALDTAITDALAELRGARQIDYSLPHTDPMSFAADDVVPLARGGPDTVENKAASHRDCNSKKRARLIAPIVRRSSSLD